MVKITLEYKWNTLRTKKNTTFNKSKTQSKNGLKKFFNGKVPWQIKSKHVGEDFAGDSKFVVKIAMHSWHSYKS